MIVLALALAAVCAALWLWLMRAVPEPDGPPAARTAPPDPITELVNKWAHDWERGRA